MGILDPYYRKSFWEAVKRVPWEWLDPKRFTEKRAESLAHRHFFANAHDPKRLSEKRAARLAQRDLREKRTDYSVLLEKFCLYVGAREWTERSVPFFTPK